jgi:hypothetical protein
MSCPWRISGGVRVPVAVKYAVGESDRESWLVQTAIAPFVMHQADIWLLGEPPAPIHPTDEYFGEPVSSRAPRAAQAGVDPRPAG